MNIILPDASTHNPDPKYLRDLLFTANLSQRDAAKKIGVSERTFRDYLNGSHKSKAPYAIQFALEVLAAENLKRPH